MSKENITCSRHDGGYATVEVDTGFGKVVTFDFRDGVPVTQTAGQARVAARYPELLRLAHLALVAS